ncbi:MAG: spheroidene monooxygenase [Actinomycetota bacterium]|nr:spheroidene monooxygenase [Actinomycetota bacterium]
MIVSVDIAEVGPRQGLRILAKPPRVDRIAGLRYAETVFTAPLGTSRPEPSFGTVALIAAWDDDAALDRFASHPLAQELAGGWQARMEPLRVFGSWPGLSGLPERPLPVDDEEPVAVITLGRLKPSRLRPFLRTSAPAERDVLTQPGLLASTGFARLPNLVSTFSLWRTAAGMRDYANRRGGSHRAAVAKDRERPFHRHSAFIRFRPYATRGQCGRFQRLQPPPPLPV